MTTTYRRPPEPIMPEPFTWRDRFATWRETKIEQARVRRNRVKTKWTRRWRKAKFEIMKYHVIAFWVWVAIKLLGF